MKNSLFITILAAGALLSACSGSGSAAVDAKAQEQAEIDRQVDSVLATMSVTEKVAQLFVIEVDNQQSKARIAEQDSLMRLGAGSLILMRGQIANFVNRANELQAQCKIPLIESTDAEWGAAMRYSEYLSYPRQVKLGAIKEGAEDLLFRMGQNVGTELKDLGIYINLAPVADMNVDNQPNHRDSRSFGSDMETVAKLSTAYMKGMMDAGIYACGKHYPGDCKNTQDAHYSVPVVTISRDSIEKVDLKPFQMMIDNGLDLMMIGHKVIPSIDTTRLPMSISPVCIRELLQEQQGFKGVVITDALGMEGVANGRTPRQVNMLAYKAGVEMLLMAHDEIGSIHAIADSVKCGSFPEADLDARVRKVLTLKARAGFFKKGFDPIVTDLDSKIKAARQRDSLLIEEMNAAIKASDPTVIINDNAPDPTRALKDRG